MSLIDRVKFDSPKDEVLIWKFPSEELRIGSQVIVNQSQEAVFVRGGRVADVLGPGTHTLTTANLPLLNHLVDLPFGGETPFSAEVWFVNKTVKRDLRWGTQTPIPLIDPEYGYPISVRAYGYFGVRVLNSRLLLTEIVGSLTGINSEKVVDYFIGEIQQKISTVLASSIGSQNISIFRINASLTDLAQAIKNEICPEFSRFGIEITNFNIERVSIPETEIAKFQEVLGSRMEIDQISKSKVGTAYTTKRTFDTLEKAAENESGGVGALLAGGVGLGAGLGAGAPLGQKLGQILNIDPSIDITNDPIAKLNMLKRLLDAHLIASEEYENRRKTILDAI